MEKVLRNKKTYILLAIALLVAISIFCIGSKAYAEESNQYELFGGNVIKDNNGGWFVKGVLTLGIPDEFYLDYWEASTGNYSNYETWENNLTEEERSYKETIDINLMKKNLSFNTLNLSTNGNLNIQVEITSVTQGSGSSRRVIKPAWAISISEKNTKTLYEDGEYGLTSSETLYSNGKYYKLDDSIYFQKNWSNNDSSYMLNINQDISSYLTNGKSYYILVSQILIASSENSSYNYLTTNPFQYGTQTYTQTFNTNGYGTVASITQEVGTSMTWPTVPNPPANTQFLQWEIQGGGVAMMPGDITSPTASGTWNARYILNTPTVTRNGNKFTLSGGSGVYQMKLPIGDWQTYDPNYEIQGGEYISFRSVSSTSYISNSAGTINYYVEDEEYNVSFNTYGYGTISDIETVHGTLTLPAQTQTPTNTTFVGWYNSNSSETLIGTAGQNILVDSDRTLYARYKYNAPSITREGNILTIDSPSGSVLIIRTGQEDEYYTSSTYELEEEETVAFKTFSSTSYILDSNATIEYQYSSTPLPPDEPDNPPDDPSVPTIHAGWYQLPQYWNLPTNILTDNINGYPGLSMHINGVSNYEEIEIIYYLSETSTGKYEYNIEYLTDNNKSREIYRSVRYTEEPEVAVLERNNKNEEYYHIYISEPIEVTEEEYNMWYSNVNNGLGNTAELEDLIYAVAEAPIKMVRQMLNFEILGVNLANLFLGILTLGLLIFILKKIKG